MEMIPYAHISDLEQALCLAASNGHFKLLSALLEIPSLSPDCVSPIQYKYISTVSGGQTALIHAVAAQEPKCVQLLLAKGADARKPSSRDLSNGSWYAGMVQRVDKHTPLHALAQTNFAASNESIAKAILDMLLSAGGDLEARDEDGATPILFTTRPSYSATISPLDVFLSAGADPCALDSSGESLLHRVCQSSSTTEVATKLLSHKANPMQARTSDGRTPLHW